MPPSAKSSMAVRTMRLGELVNSGLTHPSATEVSQNARNASMDKVPSKAFSCRARNGLGGIGFAADCASFAAAMSAFMMIGPSRPKSRDPYAAAERKGTAHGSLLSQGRQQR